MASPEYVVVLEYRDCDGIYASFTEAEARAIQRCMGFVSACRDPEALKTVRVVIAEIVAEAEVPAMPEVQIRDFRAHVAVSEDDVVARIKRDWHRCMVAPPPADGFLKPLRRPWWRNAIFYGSAVVVGVSVGLVLVQSPTLILWWHSLLSN